MRKMKLAVMLTALVALLVAGCGTERTRDDKVAAILSEMNSPFLMVNMTPENLIKKSGVNDGALPFTQKMLLSFFIDEEVTGVDYATNVQFVMCKGSSFLPNGYLIFKLKKEEVFQELLEAEANAKVEEKDGFKYVIKDSDNYVIIWNDDFAVAGNIEQDLQAMLMGGGKKNGIKSVDALIALVKAGEEGEINADYKNFLEKDADVSISYLGAGLYQYLSDMSMGQNDALDANRETIEGGNAELYLNFEDGEMNMQLLTFLSDEIKEELNMFGDKGVDARFLDFGYSANPIFTLTTMFDIDNFVDYSRKPDSMVEMRDFEEMLEEVGLTMDQATEALTGEMTLIIDRIQVVEKVVDYGYGDPYTRKDPMPIFAVMLGVADASVFNEMMAASEMVGEKIAKSGDTYVVLDDAVLFATNDSLWAFQMVAGATVKVEDKANVLTSNPLGMYLDMMTLSKMDDIDDVRIVVDLLKNIQGGGNIDEMNISLIFKDAAKNALRSLTEGFGTFGDQDNMDDEFEMLESELEEALEDAEVEAAIEEVVEEVLDEMESAN